MMVSKETAELWHHWLIIFFCSIVAYCTIYTIVFRKQLSNINRENTAKEIQFGGKTTTINENKAMHNQDLELRDTQSPSDCMKYTSVTCSLINATICSFASLSIFYHQYWKDPIYGTPGIPFYASCAIEAYFIVDLSADIVVHFVHKLASFRYDQLIHHSFSFCAIPWMIIPNPTFAWFVITLSYGMEVSTLFLDAAFFAKWYLCKESVIRKFKLGFLITWFSFRCPASIGMVIWIIMYGERLFNEYPIHKFIGAVFVISFNTMMQLAWTILIIRKTYHILTAKKPEIIDLKRRRNSIEVTNVTSQP